MSLPIKDAREISNRSKVTAKYKVRSQDKIAVRTVMYGLHFVFIA